MTHQTFSLSELLSRYVQRQAEAQEAGEVFHQPAGEVELHDPGLQPLLDTKQAWQEALEPLQLAKGTARPVVFPEWASLVAAPDSFLALPMAVGNTPQLVRNLLPLLHGDLSPRTPDLSRAVPLATLLPWVEAQATRSIAQRLLCAGLLRLAQQYDEAGQVLGTTAGQGMEQAWLNERAALVWQQGDTARALELWDRPELDDFLPALFNRGMASLFLGEADRARELLAQAITRLPETSAWHHLAQLYLTLAQAR